MSKTVDTAHVGAGNVEITLNGEKRILKPTFRAAMNLSREFGGLSGLVTRLVNLDVSAIGSVLSQGLSLTDKGREGIEETAYKSGLSDLASPCIRYISILSNGGQPVKPKTEEDGDNPNGEND